MTRTYRLLWRDGFARFPEPASLDVYVDFDPALRITSKVAYPLTPQPGRLIGDIHRVRDVRWCARVYPGGERLPADGFFEKRGEAIEALIEKGGADAAAARLHADAPVARHDEHTICATL